MNKQKKIILRLKRTIDITFASLGLLILLPLFVALGIAIKLDSSGSVFFRQSRAGKSGKVFSIYKFRTMVNNAQKMGEGVFVKENDTRITRLGKFLRRSSLDELPQLINVVKGEMSLVGPRPTLPYQIENYTEYQKKRLLLRPGITGWAQVNGRNNLSWPEKIEYDVWYVSNISIFLDIKIMFKTMGVLFKKDCLYRTGNPDFISKISSEKVINE